jgi:hypothetical protein
MNKKILEKFTDADLAEIDAHIEKYSQDIYGGEMTAQQKARYKEILVEREMFWKKQFVHEELQAKHGEVRQ